MSRYNRKILEKMLTYITLGELCRDIRNNLWKIPQDVAGIVAVPRSGFIPASIIAEFLNVGIAPLNNFLEADDIATVFDNHGSRPLRKDDSYKKILVIDDTCFAGATMSKVKGEIQKKWGEDSGYEFIYLVAYLEGDCRFAEPDIYLRDVRDVAQISDLKIVIYEWNLLAHASITERTFFDLDGVFCLDPPDERNTDAYESYIKNPTPLFIANTYSNKKLNIVTYRLIKYKKQTEAFLKKQGITATLRMFNSDSYEERSKTPPAVFKAEIYKNSNAILFVESEDWQAKEICRLSGKPVFCIGTNIMYNP